MEKTEDLVLLKLFINGNTVKSAYKKPVNKERPVIRNCFSFPKPYQGTSSLHAYKKLRL